MLQDTLADVLNTIKNADKIGKRECVVKASKIVKNVLNVIKENGYIKSFEFVDDGKQGKIIVELKGNILDCRVIKPRFSVKVKEFEKWEKRYLPARSYGILVLSTPEGIVDHNKAKELNSGGKLIAYCY